MEKSVLVTRIAGTARRFPCCVEMLSAAEYLLKAENYAFAARTAQDAERRYKFLRLAAMYRNKALTVQLGKQSGILRRCPFKRDELRAF